MKKISSATIASANSTGWTMTPPAMAMINRTTPAMSHNMSIPSFLGLTCSALVYPHRDRAIRFPVGHSRTSEMGGAGLEPATFSV